MTTLKGQEALLYWCKCSTNGYNNVLVRNFTTSWKDGLALCAIIHKFHPEVLQFDSLSKEKSLDNIEMALSTAAKLGIPKLFDAIDMMIEPMPDQRSVMTYLSQFYHVFERNSEPGMGIANITMIDTQPCEDKETSTRPKFGRSLSTTALPKSGSLGPQLQQRIPPLLTKSSTFKYVPQPKKDPSVLEIPIATPEASVVKPLLTQEIQALVQEQSQESMHITQESGGEFERSHTSLQEKVFVPSTTTISSSPVNKLAPEPLSITSSHANFTTDLSSTPNKEQSTSSVPIVFHRSATTPNISMTSLLSTSPSKNNFTETLLISQPPLSSPQRSTKPPISLSPSPTPPKSFAVKVLSTKSAGDVMLKRAEQEKTTVKSSTPPSQSKQSESRLMRSHSSIMTNSKNWVSKMKENNDFIKITDLSKAEIKKVEEREGPPSVSASDDEKVQPSPQRRFMVDKVSSSSRSTWLAKLQNRDETEEEDYEFEYSNFDRESKYEPRFDLDLKLESCLMRSSSTGKLTLPSHNKEGNAKKVKIVKFKDLASENQEPVQRTIKQEETYSQETPNGDLCYEEKTGVNVRELETARDAAIFYKDELVEKYAQLELRFKEERAANDAREQETATLHQKLASIQQQTEAKYNEKVLDMTQKLAEKDREILRLRMQNTTMKKKVEEKERDIEKLRTVRSLSPPPEAPAEDLEADMECRQLWENAEKEIPTKSLPSHSYGGLKDPAKMTNESSRSMTASPRFESKNFPDSPYSPDLIRRTSTPPLLTKVATPSKLTNSPEVSRNTETKGASYLQIRSNTPTRPNESKFLGLQRSQTPTKIEAMNKSEYKATTPDGLSRSQSAPRITVQTSSVKSPEPIKIILSSRTPSRTGTASPMAVIIKGGDKSTNLNFEKNEQKFNAVAAESNKPNIALHSSSPIPIPIPQLSPSPGIRASPSRTYRPSPPKYILPRNNASPSTTSQANQPLKPEISPISKSTEKAPLTFVTRGRANTLPTSLSVSGEMNRPINIGHMRANDQPPTGGQSNEAAKIEVIPEAEQPTPTVRLGRSYSLPTICPPKFSMTPCYIPGNQSSMKPTWLANLEKKAKPAEEEPSNKNDLINEEPIFIPKETYTLEQLVNFVKTNKYPSPSFDKSKVEWYLNDDMFQKVFSVSKVEYSRFSKWKQDFLKRKCKMDM